MMQLRYSEKIVFGILILYTLCLYGPMAMMSIGAALVFATWVGLGISKNTFKDSWNLTKNSQLFFPSITLVLACVFSLIWAQISNLEFFGKHPEIHWLKDIAKLWHLIFPFILASLLIELPLTKLRGLVRFWFILGLLSALLAIVQHYIPIYEPMELPDIGLRGYYHATGLTGFHLSFASILAFPTSFCFALFAVLIRREHLSKRVIALFVASLAFFLANIFTYSKITWVSVPLTVVLLSIVGLKGKTRMVLITIVLLGSLIWAQSNQVRLRFQGTDSIKERIEVWGANLEMIKQFPLFGVGWHHNSELSQPYYEQKGMKGFQSHAHNNFLDQWSSTGLFGLIAFLWFSSLLFFMSYKIYKNHHDLLERSLGLGLLGGWFCLHFNGLTQTNFWDAKVLHQLGWVMAITIYLCLKPNVQRALRVR